MWPSAGKNRRVARYWFANRLAGTSTPLSSAEMRHSPPTRARVNR